MNEQELFLSALDIEDSTKRQEFLDSACPGDTEMKKRVQALLASHEGQSLFLNRPVLEQVVGECTQGAAPTVGLDESGERVEDVPMSAANLAHEAETLLSRYFDSSDRRDALGRIEHYQVLEVIGRGGFGIVFRAFDEKLQRVVAIKVLSPELACTSPARKRFLREARASAKVRHENVVSIYAVEDAPIPYLVMEYVPGETLQQRLDGTGPLEVEDVLQIGKQIADGLTAAHEEGLIHRDVKPGNVLLDSSGGDHVKITDFGLARAADDASLTQSGLIAGTPLYMSPEQAVGDRLDQRTDLFSLGSVLYQMLSGRPPFRAPSTVAVLRRVAEEEPRPIQEVIAEVPDWMCAIVSNLHAKSPEQRYSTAEEVSEVLARSREDLNAGRTPVVPSRSPDDVVQQLVRSAPAGVDEPTETVRWMNRPIVKVAASLLIVMGLFAIAEAADVTDVSGTIIRIMRPGQGTLVIEIEDPSTSVTIDGEELTFSTEGMKELKLKPGEHGLLIERPGESPRRELVHVQRGGKTAFIVRQEDSNEDIGAAGFPMLSPFNAVRWRGTVPEVMVDEKWETLIAINGIPVPKMVDYCKEAYEEKWKKRFEEDLVEVLFEMGQRPGRSVDLTLADLDGKNERMMKEVVMTREKRQRLWRSQAQRQSPLLSEPRTPPVNR